MYSVIISLIFFSFDSTLWRPNVSFKLNDRVMAELRVLRLFGNPLEFLPEILPLHKLHHLSLANIRIVADDNLRLVNVQIEVLNVEIFLQLFF